MYITPVQCIRRYMKVNPASVRFVKWILYQLIKNKKAMPLTSFYSSSAGFITAMDAKEGDYVTEGGTVVRLADLSTLWAESQVYSSQLSSVDKSGEAIVQIPGTQGREVKGKI